jgi:FkbM family methyltransferase
LTNNAIKKIVNFFGFNITRYYRQIENSKYNWIKKNNIKTIIDIGANIGSFTVFIHKILPDAKIYAFEPLKDCYEKLKLNEKNIKTLKTFNLALGDKKEEKYINRSNFAPSSSILDMEETHKNAFPYTATTTMERIQIETLDHILGNENLENEILVKIDVQGYEKKVLLGAKNTLSNIKILIVELSFEELYIGTAKFDEIYNMLKTFGFNYSGSWDQLNNPMDGKPLQQDAIFVKE